MNTNAEFVRKEAEGVSKRYDVIVRPVAEEIVALAEQGQCDLELVELILQCLVAKIRNDQVEKTLDLAFNKSWMGKCWGGK